MKIYLAGPLFTSAEQDWLRKLKATILEHGQQCPDLEVIWPYELVSEEEIAVWGERAKHEIFLRCKTHLDDSDCVVALLDGTQVDDGTAWEIGYFYARKKPGRQILGIRTDFRKSGDTPNACVNLMIDCTCDVIVTSVDRLLEEVGKLVSS
ncbi:MAG: nucleoside 2-deoxyribosyltransferase [Deltaproteobacteria bacterium]|nr:nucleoside 2-deoxyribosyltransferase [Deltaproteobacteria bacterium]